MNAPARESWGSAKAYEEWVGRWSRRVAASFVRALEVPAGARWADVGCGTGALAEEILAQAAPAAVAGLDKSEAYVAAARARIRDARCKFDTGDALRLPWPDQSFDVVVSGLVLNFVSDPAFMARELARVARRGAVVAAYVWDYGGGMQMMRMFWDVAKQLRPADAALDQAERFPICQPGALEALWQDAGLQAAHAWPIEFEMVFRDFEDFWAPFLGRQGSAPTYLASLGDALRDAIREELRGRLAPRADGSIVLGGKAWAVRGRPT